MKFVHIWYHFIESVAVVRSPRTKRLESIPVIFAVTA